MTKNPTGRRRRAGSRRVRLSSEGVLGVGMSAAPLLRRTVKKPDRLVAVGNAKQPAARLRGEPAVVANSLRERLFCFFRSVKPGCGPTGRPITRGRLHIHRCGAWSASASAAASEKESPQLLRAIHSNSASRCEIGQEGPHPLERNQKNPGPCALDRSALSPAEGRQIHRL